MLISSPNDKHFRRDSELKFIVLLELVSRTVWQF